MLRALGASLIVAGFLCGDAVAQQSATQPAAPRPYRGFVPRDQAPDTRLIMPSPPIADDHRDTYDRHTFKTTRKMEGSPRWDLARADLPYAVPAMLKTFSCAAGIDLTPENAPKTADLLARVGADVASAMDISKDHFKRKRPYFIDEGALCTTRSPALDDSFDYPSGHSTWAWTIGLILTELLPDRSTDILVRARAFGESRVICGVHNPSAIEAGRTLGSVVFARLHGAAEFRARIDDARAELAALAKAEPRESCSTEASLVGKAPY